MNIYQDIYWNDQTGYRSNNDYLDSMTLERVRSLGGEGQVCAGMPVILFACGDRLCMRINWDRVTKEHPFEKLRKKYQK